MRGGSLQGIGRVAALLALLGFVLLGFGHRAAADEGLRGDPALATYLALGGSLDALCLGEDGGGVRADCPACLVERIAPGPVPLLLPTPVVRAAETRVAIPAAVVVAWASRAPPGRGPPPV
jgi:hypothetical protein